MSLSKNFHVGLFTSRAIVKETCQAIVDVMMWEYVRTLSTQEEWFQVAKGFEQRWDCHHVVGALDSKHIHIVAPPKSGNLFYNYKDFLSVVLLVVVNAQYEFIFADVGSEGRASDGCIWQKTTCSKILPTL